MEIAGIIQGIFLVVCSIVGWSIRNVLKEELRPIKNDIQHMRISLEEMSKLMTEHLDSTHPHGKFEERIDNKYVTQEQLKAALESKENIKGLN